MRPLMCIVKDLCSIRNRLAFSEPETSLYTTSCHWKISLQQAPSLSHPIAQARKPGVLTVRRWDRFNCKL